MSNEQLREALQRIQYKAVSLADAQVIALEALASQTTSPAAAPTPASSQDEPFGYFRAEPFGWTDCAATDEGAIALYERPAAPAVPAVPDTDELESALERLIERCNTDQFLCNDDAVIHAEATLERVYKSRKSTATPDAPSQPVTLTDDEACRLLADLVEGLQKTIWSSWQSTAHFDSRLQAAEDFIAALREKGKA